MKLKSVIWAIMMVFFISLAYLFYDRGFNVRTKIFTNYKEESDISYKVYLHKNDLYNKEYLEMDDNYIAKLVDKIVFYYTYSSLFDRDISGYYGYKVDAKLITYKDNSNDIIWSKDYQLANNKVAVLNTNLNSVDVSDSISIDYDKYREDLKIFKDNYGVNVNAFLEVAIVINEHINFKDIPNQIEDKKTIKLRIPVNDDMFKIDIINDNNKNGNYSDYSKREDINYMFLIIGSFCLAFGISFLALIIRDIVINYQNVGIYSRKLRKIIKENEDILVNVKGFYNKKKYNLIYLDSFDELLNVYNRVRNPISYKEVKKGEETIFLITNDDDAWIYRLVNGDGSNN